MPSARARLTSSSSRSGSRCVGGGGRPATDYVAATPFEALHRVAADARLDETHATLESRHKIYTLREALDELAETYDDIWMSAT